MSRIARVAVNRSAPRSRQVHQRHQRRRTKRPQPRRPTCTEALLDRFSASFPDGHPVWYRQSMPAGFVIETTVAGDPCVDLAGHPVVKLHGIGEFVSIHQIRSVDESQRAKVKPVILHRPE